MSNIVLTLDRFRLQRSYCPTRMSSTAFLNLYWPSLTSMCFLCLRPAHELLPVTLTYQSQHPTIPMSITRSTWTVTLSLGPSFTISLRLAQIGAVLLVTIWGMCKSHIIFRNDIFFWSQTLRLVAGSRSLENGWRTIPTTCSSLLCLIMLAVGTWTSGITRFLFCESLYNPLVCMEMLIYCYRYDAIRLELSD